MNNPLKVRKYKQIDPRCEDRSTDFARRLCEIAIGQEHLRKQARKLADTSLEIANHVKDEAHG